MDLPEDNVTHPEDNAAHYPRAYLRLCAGPPVAPRPLSPPPSPPHPPLPPTPNYVGIGLGAVFGGGACVVLFVLGIFILRRCRDAAEEEHKRKQGAAERERRTARRRGQMDADAVDTIRV